MNSKVALVTGASSGIGAAIAGRLAEAGYTVFGTDATLDEYREVRAAVNKRVKEVMETADEPRVVAEVVLNAARAAHPKLRYTAGGRAGRLRFHRTFLPAGLMDAGIRRDLRLDAPIVASAGAKR